LTAGEEDAVRIMPGGGMRAFGELEAAIMDQVWLAGRPVLVREIRDGLRPEREPAYNTVLTVVEILYRKGWLAREKDGRAYRYSPTASREDYTAGLMREVFDTSTDRVATLRRFVQRIDPAEAEELRAMLDEARGNGAGP
jgi:predicted transcriptional regulator